MLKYIYIGLISLLLAGVLNSCYEDKGVKMDCWCKMGMVEERNIIFQTMTLIYQVILQAQTLI